MLLGTFELGDRVGKGGMGVVHRGRYVGPGENVDVAVKFVTGPGSAARSAEAAFLREARFAAQLNHPGIVTSLDAGRIGPEIAESVGVADGTPYLVMEWVEGGTLDERTRALDWRWIRYVLARLLSALGHAHALGILHRDIKPSNVLCRTRSDGFDPLLTDFGIGRAYEVASPEDEHGPVVGTPYYMAPEQILGSWRDEGPWSDLYSLGILAWRLTTGTVPFRGERQEVLRAHLSAKFPDWRPITEVPADLERWLRRMTARNVEGRFSTAADAARALLALEPARAQRSRGRVHRETPTTTRLSATRLPVEGGTWDHTQPLDFERAAGESGARPPTSEFVPLPARWLDEDRVIERHLRGAGLGLFGLRRTPLVGRHAEKQALWDAVRASGEDRLPRCVVLRGFAGSGKSALAEWLARRGAEVGALTTFRAYHHEQPSVGHGLEGMIERRFRTQDLPFDEALARVRTSLGPMGLDPAALLQEALGMVERIVPTSDDQADRARILSRSEWFMGVRRVIEYEARHRHVLVILDDAHWSEASIEFALGLLHEARGAITVVVTLRDPLQPERRGQAAHETLTELCEHPRTRTHTLAPLSTEDQRELVERLLGLEATLADEVVRRTAGHPLFAVQLVGDWVARGILEVGPDGFHARKGAASRLPDDIHSTWQERIASVLAPLDDPEAARGALELAAILGRDVDEHEWRRAADGELPLDLIDGLERFGLLDRRAVGWSFVHGMLHESIVQDIPSARIPALHRRCAAAIQGVAGRLAGRSWERIAEHCSAAGDYGDALVAITTAVTVHFDRENAEGVLRAAPLVQPLAEAAGRPHDLGVAESLARWGTILRFTLNLAAARETTARALELALEGRSAEEFLKHPDKRRNWVISRAHSEFALFADEEGDGEGALRHSEEAQYAAAAAGLVREEAWAASIRTSTLNEIGRLAEAHRTASAALKRLESNGDGTSKHAVHVLYSLAENEALQGHREAAIAYTLRAVSLASRLHSRASVAYGETRLAALYWFDGDLDLARLSATRAREIYLAAGSTAAGYLDVNIASFDADEGRYNGHRPRLKQLLDEFVDRGWERLTPLIRLMLATCAAGEGDWETSERLFEEAMHSQSRSGRVVPEYPAYLLYLAEAARDGRPALAARALAESRTHQSAAPRRIAERMERLAVN